MFTNNISTNSSLWNPLGLPIESMHLKMQVKIGIWLFWKLVRIMSTINNINYCLTSSTDIFDRGKNQIDIYITAFDTTNFVFDRGKLAVIIFHFSLLPVAINCNFVQQIVNKNNDLQQNYNKIIRMLKLCESCSHQFIAKGTISVNQIQHYPILTRILYRTLLMHKREINGINGADNGDYIANMNLFRRFSGIRRHPNSLLIYSSMVTVISYFRRKIRKINQLSILHIITGYLNVISNGQCRDITCWRICSISQSGHIIAVTKLRCFSCLIDLTRYFLVSLFWICSYSLSTFYKFKFIIFKTYHFSNLLIYCNKLLIRQLQQIMYLTWRLQSLSLTYSVVHVIKTVMRYHCAIFFWINHYTSYLEYYLVAPKIHFIFFLTSSKPNSLQGNATSLPLEPNTVELLLNTLVIIYNKMHSKNRRKGIKKNGSLSLMPPYRTTITMNHQLVMRVFHKPEGHTQKLYMTNEQ
jgi:hypothetical protein